MAEPDPNHFLKLVAAIWRRDGMYLPAIACKLKPSGGYWFIAIKTPLIPCELPVTAAQTAQLDLIKAAAELESPRTELDAFLFMFKIGYRVGSGVMLTDVAPADLVLRRESELDGLILECRPEVDAAIREGDPPIMRETFDRLIREGFSSEEAANVITRAHVVEFFRQAREEPDVSLLEQSLSRLPKFPDNTPYSDPDFQNLPARRTAEDPEPNDESDSDANFPYGGVAYAMQILRRQKEGIPQQTIVPLNPFEQLVLEALEHLMTPRWVPDPSQYPDYAGRQYFMTTPIGERSLKKAHKKSAG